MMNTKGEKEIINSRPVLFFFFWLLGLFLLHLPMSGSTHGDEKKAVRCFLSNKDIDSTGASLLLKKH